MLLQKLYALFADSYLNPKIKRHLILLLQALSGAKITSSVQPVPAPVQDIWSTVGKSEVLPHDFTEFLEILWEYVRAFSTVSLNQDGEWEHSLLYASLTYSCHILGNNLE